MCMNTIGIEQFLVHVYMYIRGIEQFLVHVYMYTRALVPTLKVKYSGTVIDNNGL